MQEPIVLALFVIEQGRDEAMSNLSACLENWPPGSYVLFEFNLSQYPGITATAGVVAVPLLVRYWPLPRVYIVGNLCSDQSVIEALDSDKSTVVDNSEYRDYRREQNFKNPSQFRVVQSRKLQALTVQTREFVFEQLGEMSAIARQLANPSSGMKPEQASPLPSDLRVVQAPETRIGEA